MLPLSRLEDMLAQDKKGLKDLLTTLRKEKVTASANAEEEEAEDKEAEEPEENEEASVTPDVEIQEGPEAIFNRADSIDARGAAEREAPPRLPRARPGG